MLFRTYEMFKSQCINVLEHLGFLVFNYKWKGVSYSVTIGGGNAYANKAITWYGPEWLAAYYGATGGHISPASVLGGSNNFAGPGLGGARIYIVKHGDCLWKISRKLGVSVRYLVEKNSIKNENRIYPGQQIVY
ncbi:MAG: LysM peptidoglycan-binding domain-containing protein [Lachnospiraceae bacterium]|nr:LysM peptidoglycan-binding domain-containing protein [Lachnospiraceae bacterium]